ncbi:hypothetical protein [Sulfurimicrobium lacus]|uniref:hypothetical protein n=1 Tax=Sulfurimicrobium lacus TaxID=2715678 RepID=UPI001567B991|nr:hypothetical protein [Sulfurimicrobium lacus]
MQRYRPVLTVLLDHGNGRRIAPIRHESRLAGICDDKFVHPVQVHPTRTANAMRMRVQQGRKAL